MSKGFDVSVEERGNPPDRYTYSVKFRRLLRLEPSSPSQHEYGLRNTENPNAFWGFWIADFGLKTIFFTPRPLSAYRITLFALSSTRCGIVSPICFAALKLIMNSNFVACCTGKSAGLAPFKILST